MNETKHELVPEREPRTVMLCGGGSHPCCPKVTISDTEIVITDDFGGEVVLTHAQLEQLQKLSV